MIEALTIDEPELLVDRMCIVTREVKDEDALIRFVRSPEGVATPDLRRKLPGRGVWVSNSKAKVEEAMKRNMFSRGFSDQTSAPADMADTIARLHRELALASLSFARKAGEAVSGFMKVQEAMQKGPVRVLLHAAEAGHDGSAKLNKFAKANTLIFGHFRPDELDLAFGKPNVVHVAIARGGLAEKLAIHVQRIADYEGLEDMQRVKERDR